MARPPSRIDGYAPLRDYAAVGDGRSAALVALDGSIDWLCAPRFDRPSVFAALLDPQRGGRFTLGPQAPFEAERRYLPDTNVLETTFRTADGTVRVVDAMSAPLARSSDWQELVRHIECTGGEVPMQWRVEPRFETGARHGDVIAIDGAAAIRDGSLALLVQAWGGEPPEPGDGVVRGSLRLSAGDRATLALGVFEDEPWLVSPRHEVEARLEETAERWRRWIGTWSYEGPWREAVARSALALALLVHTPTGAMVAAATTSLPEAIGGDRNFDYRFCWVRDASFALEAMEGLGFRGLVHGSFAWLLRAIERTYPRICVFYDLEGVPRDDRIELGLAGYRNSRPVVAGNRAANQVQLGSYADLLAMAEIYSRDGNRLHPRAGEQLALALEHLERIWHNPDSCIWELPEQRQYTQGKLAAWIAFDRGARLARAGELPGGEPAARHFDAVADQVSRFVERHCWSPERRSYVRQPGSAELDASVLVAARAGYDRGREGRFRETIAALRNELGSGPLIHRYSGMQEVEGAFVACSFWLAETLARLGQRDQAAALIEEMIGQANDVGLYSEEIDASSGDFLGNFPQALSHLALVNAAHTLTEAGA